MSKKVLVINGPNLGLLGKREPDVYGNINLTDIENTLKEHAKGLDIELEFFQSDIEGEIVKRIGEAWKDNDSINGMIINPAGYTHTSVAIHDAVKASKLPTVEVHISPIYKREEFRHTSVISSACAGQISGFGKDSYVLGLIALSRLLNEKNV
ncbi:type II 3-dehydroquinate dehydratase [bacterium]